MTSPLDLALLIGAAVLLVALVAVRLSNDEAAASDLPGDQSLRFQ